ncbi:MAG TPA: glycosyltransferase [Gemmatimonadaceae bacterium]|nr:glycosyltransferase [Gemmatimonadaceae bacterium]
MSESSDHTRSLVETLAMRERHRDWYLRNRDPIAADRMLWRAHAFRQLVHLLPGQSILELGCGEGAFTRQLLYVSRGENPITAVTFQPGAPPSQDEGRVSVIALASLPGPLAGRNFDLIVGMDLLDRRTSSDVLQRAYELLSPGGEVVFFESNPWNIMLRARRALERIIGRRDPRTLVSRPQLYELMSEVGFIRVFAVFTDFVYAPLTRRLIWLLRNLSIVLENTPGARTLAGAILVHAQKPPRTVERTSSGLSEHAELHGAVSVVIPCHNEEMNVRPLVQRLRELYDQYLHEIILVDDNSTDGTRQVITALASEDARVRPVHRVPPNGVGRAIADGYRVATGRYILSMDCDFQHLLPEIRDLFDAAADGYDVVVGSRFSRHSVLLNYPFQKVIANRGFHTIAQLVLLRRFRDLTNNLKLMRREVAARLVLKEPGFAVNAETGLQPLVMGYRVAEVPISWINRAPDMGSSSFRLMRVGGGYWRVLRRILRRLRTGGGAYAALGVGPGVSTTWLRAEEPARVPEHAATARAGTSS